MRNLSWRADQASKKILREVGAVSTLMKAAVEAKKESTLKSILSALWNLSAHCSMNKADICAVDGALAFLVGTLTYKSPSKTHAIIENGGGILRNISSHIAVQEEYRAILRKHNCLQILLQHLRSPSLTIVSNACGTLWNLSARCTEDQQMLWDLGAVSMLRNLVHSKHKMISMGSSAALKNLLSSKPGGLAAAADKQKSGAPSLLVRKQKFLEAELDQNLSETCENLDSPKTSPTHHRSESELKYNSTRNTHNRPSAKMCQPPLGPYQIHERMYHSTGGHYPHKQLARSDSKESLISTRSDSSHDRLRNLNILLHSQKRGLQQEDTDDLPDVLSAPPGVLESRIQYVMQEVTRQIAMEKNEMVNSDCGSRGASYLKSASSQLKHAATSEASVSSQLSKCMQPPLNGVDNGNLSPRNTIYNKYSNLSSMIENLNLDDGEPVNYSLKYPEEAGHCFENKHIDDVSEVQLVPKVDNCVSNGLHSNDLNQNEISKKYCNAVKQTNIDWHSSHNRTPSAFQLSSNQTMYAHYAETDLDDPDQPTNYSLMYTEDTDTTDNFCPPAPKDERPYFTQEYPAKGPSIHDDTIKTYCTEDTPLNFSTATSLTDLREIKDGNCNVSDDLQEEKCSGNDDKSKCEGLSDQLNDSKQSETCKMVTEEKSGVENKSRQQETCHDKAVTYCVEGTPVSYSRVSSLSSIHSNDIGDNGLTTSPPPPPPLPPPPDNLQCHSPQALSNAADISFGHPHGKGTVGSSRQHQELCDVKPGLTSVNVTDKTRPCMTSGRTEKIINGIHEGA